jgi:hypothetical protein
MHSYKVGDILVLNPKTRKQFPSAVDYEYVITAIDGDFLRVRNGHLLPEQVMLKHSRTKPIIEILNKKVVEND